MFTTYRYWYKYGCEDDEVEVTVKEFDNLEKAINYAHRYAKGSRFCGVQIENEDGDVIYEITEVGDVFDYRDKFISNCDDVSNENCTQKEPAEAVNVMPSMVNQIERGTKTLTVPLGCELAKVLGCDLADLTEQ